MLLALSTLNKVALLIAAGAFIAFALASSFVFPRRRPDYPGPGGMRTFVAVSLVLFVVMLTAVELFAKEEEEHGEAERKAEPAERETPPTTAPNRPRQRSITVSETEYKIELPRRTLTEGQYVFQLENDGSAPHDLVIKGPGVEDARTPVIDGGERASLKVALKRGTYEFYCSVPGHKDQGMSIEVDVS